MPSDDTRISRVTRTRETARVSYNKISKWYDLFARAERKYNDYGLRKLNVREGERVLEIGFGTGHCIVALAQSVGRSGTVYGIDLSDGMCNVTRSRVEKAGLSGRVELTCGDATVLPFEANRFDAVFMGFTLELFDTPDIAVVLGECHRVLRSDGRMGVVALSQKAKANIVTRLYNWAHRQFPSYVDCRPILVRKALAGFRMLDVIEMTMWGLPVEIAVAVNR